MTNCPICNVEPMLCDSRFGLTAPEAEYVAWCKCPKCGMCSAPEGGGAFIGDKEVQGFAAANWETLAAAVAEALKGGEA